MVVAHCPCFGVGLGVQSALTEKTMDNETPVTAHSLKVDRDNVNRYAVHNGNGLFLVDCGSLSVTVLRGSEAQQIVDGINGPAGFTVLSVIRSLGFEWGHVGLRHLL